MCMCITHRQNPFHRIECWTGTHFHQAELWEVGTYLLVQHQTDQPICHTLHFQMKYLETFEEMKDKAEQELANWEANGWHQPYSHQSASAAASGPSFDSGLAAGLASGLTESTPNEIRADAAFFNCLDALSHQGKSSMEHVQDNLQDFFDGDDECEVEHADEDLHGFEPYLPDRMQVNQTMELEPTTMLPTADAKLATMLPIADALNNSYICVVHMNRIHHLAMVTCHCQGEH
jgi:hypothetical protein